MSINCADAATLQLAPGSLDAVFTDPPYFANVQHGELMDFCYVWLRRLVGVETESFEQGSTRNAEELTGNATQARGLEHFTEGLAQVYERMADALKPGAPFAFTYHHNSLEAYFPAGVAILDAGLTCSATLPCPAEMSGSVHIHGTASSIIDTVFVCRRTDHLPAWAPGHPPDETTAPSSDELESVAAHDVALLSQAGYRATKGDMRCIVFGHLTRMAAGSLLQGWDRATPVAEKLARFGRTVSELADPEYIVEQLTLAEAARTPAERLSPVDEPAERTPGAIAV